MIKIDGSEGEGGGQILRTSLALSLITGQPFEMEKVRAGRKKPGLLRQHLAGVKAAAEIGGASVQGAELGSQSIRFKPKAITPGDYHFTIGSAGSSTLVLQAILPALMLGTKTSSVTIEGGTHNPQAPPFDFLEKTFLPVLARMGPKVTMKLEAPGFYPAGGGKIVVTIEPVAKLQPIEILERGEIRRRLASAVVANLPISIAERELKIVAKQLNWPDEYLAAVDLKGSISPGNLVLIELESESITEVITAFGERGLVAESVASAAVLETKEYLAQNCPVGIHTADQLLIPMALAGGGAFRTMPPSRHTLTNMETISKFLPVNFKAEKENGCWTIRCEAS
ncbi:MAG: RNA 3'-terminal phosphate cyclase [Verrucomicrobiales bacterium]